MLIPEYKLRWQDIERDQLDDVIPSHKYMVEFGDGPVPITHTDHLYFRSGSTDQVQALFDTLAVFEHSLRTLGRIDKNEVAALISEYRAIQGKHKRSLRTLMRDGGDPNAIPEGAEWHRCVQIVRELAAAGLKLTPLRRIVLRDHFNKAFNFHLDNDTWHAMDNACLAGDNYKRVAERLSLATNTTRAWWVARGYPFSEARDEAMYWLRQHQIEFGPAVMRGMVMRAMSEKYPWCEFELSYLLKRLTKVDNGVLDMPEKRASWIKPW